MRKLCIAGILIGLLIGLGGIALAQYPTVRRMPTVQEVDAPKFSPAGFSWVQTIITICGSWVGAWVAVWVKVGKIEVRQEWHYSEIQKNHKEIKELCGGFVTKPVCDERHK